MRKQRTNLISLVRDRLTQKQTFNDENIARLKELYPDAKNFVYFKLPKNKEVSIVINKGANLKKSIQTQINHLKTEFGYTDAELTNVETYYVGDK